MLSIDSFLLGFFLGWVFFSTFGTALCCPLPLLLLFLATLLEVWDIGDGVGLDIGDGVGLGWGGFGAKVGLGCGCLGAEVGTVTQHSFAHAYNWSEHLPSSRHMLQVCGVILWQSHCSQQMGAHVL